MLRQIAHLFAYLACAATMAATPARAQHPCARPDQVLEHPMGTPHAYGEALAANADWLALGDPGDGAGAVFLYERDGDGWHFRQRLEPAGEAVNFGRAIAISEDVLLVGAPNDFVSHLEGAIFIYNLIEGEWELDSRHAPPASIGAGSGFGDFVAIEGSYAAVIASKADLYGHDLGAVLVYRRDAASVWDFDGDATPDYVASRSRRCERAWPDLRGPSPVVVVEVIGAIMALERIDGEWQHIMGQPWGGNTTVAGGLVARADDHPIASDDDWVKVYEHDRGQFTLVDTVEIEEWGGASMAFGRSAAAAPSDHPDLLIVGEPAAQVTARHRGRGLLLSRSDRDWRIAAQLLMPDEGLWVAGSAATISSGAGRRPFGFVHASNQVGVFNLEALCGACTPEHEPAGEVTLTMRAAGDLTPSNPATSLEVLAWFSSSDAALAAVEFDLEAAEPAFGDPFLHLPVGGTTPGSVTPDLTAVRDIYANQSMHYRYGVSNYSNPIVLWSGVFTTEDFRPRDIPLRAIVSDFSVYPVDLSTSTASRLDSYVETVGALRVRQTADCDGSGALDFADFLCFQDRFAAGDPRADFDADGEITFFDFLAFQEAFVGGCP